MKTKNGKSYKKIYNITWYQNVTLCNHLLNWVFEKPYFGNFLASFNILDSFHCYNQSIFYSFMDEYTSIWILLVNIWSFGLS